MKWGDSLKKCRNESGEKNATGWGGEEIDEGALQGGWRFVPCPLRGRCPGMSRAWQQRLGVRTGCCPLTPPSGGSAFPACAPNTLPVPPPRALLWHGQA